MVSLRCKMVVKAEFAKLGLPCVIVDLGIIETLDEIPNEELETLRINLSRSGLELLDDKKNTLVVKIKDTITEMIYYSEDVPNVNYSDYLSEKLGHDYTYLSNVFSEAKGMTIQQFIIINKIKRVKELLLDDQLSLTDISYRLNYSSVSHLSNQFKKITGFTPSVYKQMMTKNDRGSKDPVSE